MNRSFVRIAGIAIMSLALSHGAARAQFFDNAYQPRVPVSALARPAAWLDPGRLHVMTSVSVASGWSGGTQGLQVTRLAYQFARPAWLEVSLGNAFGPANAGTNGMFLEGLRLGFRPSASTVFQIQYQNIRSPLQLQRDPFGPLAW